MIELSAVNETIAKMTPKGRETMTAVGNREFAWFDDGIVGGSGIWGECFGVASGVLNRLRDLGMWECTEEGEVGSGLWWALTELGAAVANTLAARSALDELEYVEPVVETPQVTVKTGAKWTYLYAADGSLIAEIRNDQFAAIAAHLAN